MTISPGIDIDVSARLCAAVDANTLALQRQAADRARLFAAVTSFRPPSFQLSSLPSFAAAGWGPNDGFNWAVQQVTVEGLATSDHLEMYVGSSKASAVAGNGRFSFTITASSTFATYSPGRTGMILHGGGQDSLAFGGSIAGTVTVNTEVIQVTDEQLPYFLL